MKIRVVAKRLKKLINYAEKNARACLITHCSTTNVSFYMIVLTLCSIRFMHFYSFLSRQVES